MDQQQVFDALRDVLDPELGINIVDLGLVYSVEIDGNNVHIALTMTTRACPLHSYLTEMSEAAVRQYIPDAAGVEVQIVWDPPWTPAMMSARAKEQLGWSG